MTGIERKARLKTLEPEQDAQCLAGGWIGIDNMDQPVTVEKRMIIALVAHFALSAQLASFA
ncbi:hypothetical protein N8D56_24580 [Devosia sp. A8/3-2]|nr:hypothetical protein N8D56_24580 [Devosia sp. A8/3-2]